MERKGRKKRLILALTAAVTLIFAACAGVYLLKLSGLIPGRVYAAGDFGIEILRSRADGNKNGVDDYTDILLGARADAEKHPVYDGRYWAGGYPPDDIGVCTDVIWRAFKNAGYSLREMVDEDIRARPGAYEKITVRDKNIDFRRVGNLRVFFEEHGRSLTLDKNKIGEWQPGDIVVFGNDMHIGIVSDRRNSKGVAYIIHNGGQKNREEDLLSRTREEITGHYRFDASAEGMAVLVFWAEDGE